MSQRPPMRIGIIDTETTGVSAEHDHLVEVAVGIYVVAEDPDPCGLTVSASWLVGGAPPEAVMESSKIHGIHPRLLDGAPGLRETWSRLERMLGTVDAVASHTTFDRDWMPEAIRAKPWIDTCWDVEWPRFSSSRKLTEIALAHGVGVSSAHRALDDVMTLVRLLNRVADSGTDMLTLIQRALRPKVRVESLASYDEKDVVKAAGFQWDGKVWSRTMFVDDVPTLPFRVRTIEQSSSDGG